MGKTIAYFHSTATASSGPKVNGIYRAASKRGWSVLRFDIRNERQVSETLAYWHPDGCIVEAAADNIRLPLDAFSRVPHLYLDCNPALRAKGESCIIQDASAIAECAADELLQYPLRSYAYAAWPERQFWSLLRGREFIAVMAKRKQSVSVFRTHAAPQDITSVREMLVGWIKTLDLPVGIFTATDSLSALVLDAAAKCGLNVPENIRVIGVDNEEFTCETARPTLSSIDPGFEYAGQQAVEMLNRLMNSRRKRQIVEKFKDPFVMRRSSTRLPNTQDVTATRAIDFIRQHASEGISSAKVLALFNCSRCLAERRFRAVANRSVLEEIHAVQVEAAKKLIRRPFQKLELVPQLCGYSSSPFFQKLFKRMTGFSMSEWRDRN
ncbi:MAG: substrate-binding domain-containing protein [Kiritimatiellae bacterium]|nr:substrate-binding domain-containing protein [Kiritimatiellia bacterium]